MAPDQLAQRIVTILWCCAIPVALYAIVRFLLIEYRLHKNSIAPVCTDRAVAYYKHRDRQLPYMGRGYDYVCHITFHTDHGEVLKLYMTGQEFFEIQENDVGVLTWQGTKLWKFEPEKKEE